MNISKLSLEQVGSEGNICIFYVRKSIYIYENLVIEAIYVEGHSFIQRDNNGAEQKLTEMHRKNKTI